MNIEYKNLVCGAGGVWGYSYVGAIDKVFTDEQLKGMVNFLGSSVGSIFATVLACRGSKDFLRMKFNELDASKLQDNSFGIIRDLYRLVTKFGYNKGDYIYGMIQNILVELGCLKNATFSQVYETFGSNLIIVGANVTTRKVCYFNRLTHSNMEVAEAVRISACIPLFYKARKINNEYYVDGGVIDGYPMRFMSTDLYILLNNYDPKIIGPYGPYDNKVTLDRAMGNIDDLSRNDLVTEDPRVLRFILEMTVGIKAYSSRTIKYIDPSQGSNNPRQFNIVSFSKEIVDMLMDASLKQLEWGIYNIMYI